MKRFVVALLLIAACASPERKASDAQKSAESWLATAKVTSEQWRRGAVPDAYVRSTARVAIAELQKLDAPSRDEALRIWRELQDATQ